MSEDDLKELVLKHDHIFSSLASSNEHLANELSKTNDKLEEVAKAINTQNILSEKFNNLDKNLKESFGRVHDKMRKVDEECTINSKTINKIPSTATLRWFTGILIVYLASFGIYVVSSLHTNENQITYLKGRIKK